MLLKVADAPAFKAAIDAIVNLVEEGQFEVSAEGVRFRAMDPSQISMVSFFMPKEAFVEYNVNETTKLGVDITQLAGVLSRGKKGESIEISTEGGRLVVVFVGQKRKRTFKVPLIEIGHVVQREPKIDFYNYVLIRADAFKDAVKDVKLMSSHVKLQLLPDRFVIDVKGDNGEVKIEYENGAEEVKEIKTEEGARATFPLQYLEDMMKATPSSSFVKINLETDKPLKLEYEIEGARVIYYLAPRIESE